MRHLTITLASTALLAACVRELPVVDELQEGTANSDVGAAAPIAADGCSTHADVVFEAPNDLEWLAWIKLVVVGDQALYVVSGDDGSPTLRALSDDGAADREFWRAAPGTELRAVESGNDGLVAIIGPVDSPRDGTLVNTIAVIPPGGGPEVPLPNGPHLEDRVGDPYIIGADARYVYAGWQQRLIYRTDRSTGETTLLLEADSFSNEFLYYDSKIYVPVSGNLSYLQADDPDPKLIKWGRYGTFCGITMRFTAGGLYCAGSHIDPDGTETPLRDQLGADNISRTPLEISTEQQGKLFVHYTIDEAPHVAEMDPVTRDYDVLSTCSHSDTNHMVATSSAVYWSRGLEETVVIERLAR